ncbi:MAG: CRISPR-associated endonuclease Cas1 [Armatimonadetes bacterium]|nr:CRISPR-associated endonuclease Cas1 [Armatimonadota bacterium]
MSILIVDEFGCFVGKSGDLVQVRKSGETLTERPIDDLACIALEGRGISISVDLVHECARRGIPIDCLDFDGEPFAKIMSPMLTATVETRREQLDAYDDERGLSIARELVVSKLANQRSLLLYFAKYRRKTEPELADALQEAANDIARLASECRAVPGPNIDAARPSILNTEGRAGSVYWEAVWKLLPPELSPGKRVHQGATDPINVLLNYGYGILQSQCWTAVLLAGLDPFGGFIHVDRPGRPSLVLDLQEPFRQPVVDRTVISVINKGFRPRFEDNARLDKQSRRQFAAQVLERMETPTDFAGNKEALKHIIVRQARSIAVAVRGEKPFRGFTMRW